MRVPYRLRAISDSGQETAADAIATHNQSDEEGWACRTVSNIETHIPLGLRDYGFIALAGVAGFTLAFWLACQGAP